MTTTNTANFINFKSRNFSHRGDRGTWARIEEDGSITFQMAARGTLSWDYIDELREFLAGHGVDFDSIHPGERVSFK